MTATEGFVSPETDDDGIPDSIHKELLAFKQYMQSNYDSVDLGFDLTVYWADGERVKSKISLVDEIVDYGNLK